MTEKSIVPLGPEALAFADNARLLFEIAESQAPINAFFTVYQRVMSGSRQPGDVVKLARQLIAVFGGDRASLLWRLGRPGQDSMTRFQLVVQEREGAFADVEERLKHYAKRLEKRRIEAEIFHAIQSLVDNGKPLGVALEQLAGQGVARLKGPETLRKIWLAKNREMEAGVPRLKPIGGAHPFAAEVIAPGRKAKKTGRPKKR